MSQLTFHQISFLMSPDRAAKKIQLLRYKIKEIQKHEGFHEMIIEGKDYTRPKNMSYVCSYGKWKKPYQIVVNIHFYTIENTEILKEHMLNCVKDFKFSRITEDKHKNGAEIFYRSVPIDPSSMTHVYVYKSSPYYTNYFEKADKDMYSQNKLKINNILSLNSVTKDHFKNKTADMLRELREEVKQNMNSQHIIEQMKDYEKERFCNIIHLNSKNHIYQPHIFLKNRATYSNYGITNIKMDFSEKVSLQEKVKLCLNGIGGKRGLGMGFIYPPENIQKELQMIEAERIVYE